LYLIICFNMTKIQYMLTKLQQAGDFNTMLLAIFEF
jgi:hypothetical protein